MILLLYILVFGFSIGLSVLGVMTSYRLKESLPNSYFSSLFYFQAFSFIYGFYGIWGTIISRTILGNLSISETHLENILSLLPFIGIPFLIVAWYLLLKLCLELKGIKSGQLFPILFFSSFSLVFLCSGILFKYCLDEHISMGVNDISKAVLVMNFLIAGIAGCFLFFSNRKSVLSAKENYLVIAVIVVFPLLILIANSLIHKYSLATLFFVLFFFMSPALLAGIIFLKMRHLIAEPESFESMADFLQKYEISKRETEIIREICDGKSNREISEKLFISLQTVKDHSHRIYTKTGVSNRVQLTNLVREKIKPGPTPERP